MTGREDMRYWPFEEYSNRERSLKRIRNGMTDSGIRWAVMGQSGYTPGCNGYAQIPWEGHPWTGIENYDEMDVEVHGGLTYGPHPSFDFGQSVEDLMDATAGTDHPFVTDVDTSTLSAHPAVTFADVGGWVGFDTLHAWDVWPDEELARIGLERKTLGGMFPLPSGPHDIFWTLDMVMSQVHLLANQIAIKGLVTKANRKVPGEDRETQA